MTANDDQVGGRHYKSSYEHWDLVLATGMGYLEGQATKYVVRWRRKNGVEDLRKAQHFLDKIAENQLRARLIAPRAPRAVVLDEVELFASRNALPDRERLFVRVVASWENSDDLALARGLLRDLLGEAALPVPLTEENHYSERSK